LDDTGMYLPTTNEAEDGLHEVTEAERATLDTRWESFERDPSRALTLEQFRALIEAKWGLRENGE